MKLKDAPIGLFKCGNTLALKTEYYVRQHDGGYKPECFIVSSGEYFHGGVDSLEEFNNLEVQPVSFCEDCINLYDKYKTSNIKTEEEIKERIHDLSIKIEKECFKGFPDQRVVDSYKYRMDELYWVLGGEIWT